MIELSVQKIESKMMLKKIDCGVQNQQVLQMKNKVQDIEGFWKWVRESRNKVKDEITNMECQLYELKVCVENSEISTNKFDEDAPANMKLAQDNYSFFTLQDNHGPPTHFVKKKET